MQQQSPMATGAQQSALQQQLNSHSQLQPMDSNDLVSELPLEILEQSKLNYYHALGFARMLYLLLYHVYN